VQALAGCLTVWDHAVHGITNKSLRAWMTGLRGTPYSMNQAPTTWPGYAATGLIERIARTNTYRLTADGLTFALVYSRVHDQVLYPLTAHDQPIAAPAPVRAAWRAITRHIDSTIAAATSDARPEPMPVLARGQHRLKTQTNVKVPRPRSSSTETLPTAQASYLGVYESGALQSYQPVANFSKALAYHPTSLATTTVGRNPSRYRSRRRGSAMARPHCSSGIPPVPQSHRSPRGFR